MADKYEIKVVTNGDPRGAEKVADSLKKVDNAAKDTAKASTSAAKGMNEYGEASQKGAAVGRVLGQVLSGNVAAVSQLGAALKALGAAIRTNVVGVVLIAATGLWSFFQNLRRDVKATGDSVKDATVDIEAQKAAVEKLNQVRIDSLKAQLEGISTAAKAALDAVGQVLDATERIEEATMAVELAEIGADKTLSPEQRAQREFNVRQRYADSRLVRDQWAAHDRVAILQRDYTEKSAMADTAEQRRDAQSRLVDATTGRQGNLNAAMRGLNEQYQAALSRAGRDEATKRALAEEYQARGAALGVAQGVAFGPAAEGRLGAMQAGLSGLDAQAKAARTASDAAYAALREAQQKSALEFDHVRPTVRGLERNAARISAGLPEPAGDIAPVKYTYDQRAIISYAEQAGAKNGAEMAKIMQEMVDRMMAAEREKFRDQIKTLIR